MASENAKVRPLVFKLLDAAGLHPVKVENAIGTGTPDLNCSAGWIELKHRDGLPAKPLSPVTFRHFTTKQRKFLRERWEAKPGDAWLLIYIGDAKRWDGEWLLFSGAMAADVIGTQPINTLRQVAWAWWKGRAPTAKQLKEELTK